MKYRRAKMVNWFEPAVLLQSGLKSVISKLFGNYADRRETQAALDDLPAFREWETQMDQYAQASELWVDFISDTGDGFNSTYSVALLAAQKILSVQHGDKIVKLPRGKILILGGDQIYPTPTGDLYERKFKIPFEAALPEDSGDPDFPHLYAIPGNHDWYDGLGNFMKVFCQQRWIGNWKTYQTRSYFAIPLPGRYWLWATDIQLNEDIDKPQQNYFRDIARDKMKAGDKVILCTAEPAWVYKQLYKNNRSYERLEFFIKTYITEDAAQCIGHTFQLATVITGDLHHYAHYCEPHEAEAHHFIGAGGGGAFLHLTHNLPRVLNKLGDKNLERKAIFPDANESRSLLWRNFLFPFYNRFFALLLGLVHVLFFWMLESHLPPLSDDRYAQSVGAMPFSGFLSFTAIHLISIPSLTILTALLLFGFYKFTDTRTGLKGVGIFGAAHSFVQVSCIFLLIWFLSGLHHPDLSLTDGGQNQWILALMAAELLFAGSLTGGFIMGFYLLISDIALKIHIDESSSSLTNEDYKSFLRMHISGNTLTIYPIGIRKVTKKWKQKETGSKFSFDGKLPACHLIEQPIEIKLN